jgi:alpha-glucosidase (family GH31 glycosyl hydrolase)
LRFAAWLNGGQQVTVEAPLGHIPLFAAGGSTLNYMTTTA